MFSFGLYVVCVLHSPLSLERAVARIAYESEPLGRRGIRARVSRGWFIGRVSSRGFRLANRILGPGQGYVVLHGRFVDEPDGTGVRVLLRPNAVALAFGLALLLGILLGTVLEFLHAGAGPALLLGALLVAFHHLGFAYVFRRAFRPTFDECIRQLGSLLATLPGQENRPG